MVSPNINNNNNQQPDNNPNQEIVFPRLERQRAIALPNIYEHNNITIFNLIQDMRINNPGIFMGRVERYLLQEHFGQYHENINLPRQQ